MFTPKYRPEILHPENKPTNVPYRKLLEIRSVHAVV
jgi:hypothetical protein